MSADARARLLDLLRSRAFERRRAVLASGKESDFFIDCKQVASAVALTSFLRGAPLDAIYVRKEAKDHGTGRLIHEVSRRP